MIKKLLLQLSCLTATVALVGAFEPSVKAESVKELFEPLEIRPDGQPNRAAWMAKGGFGMMVHYWPQAIGNTQQEKIAYVNKVTDSFNLNGFMKQFEESGADWLIFTFSQQPAVFNSPNPMLLPDSGAIIPKRDVMMEIALRLKKINKRLILYTPSKIEPIYKTVLGGEGEEYERRYLAFIKAYSEKFGILHDGWWFDSCQPDSEENWKKLIEACRAGNPDSAIAFSGAEFCTGGPVEPRCTLEDYHAGEIHLMENGKIRRDFINPYATELTIRISDGVALEKDDTPQQFKEPRYHMPESQYMGQVQWHCLLPIGQTFNPGIPNRLVKYSDEELFTFVNNVKKVGGAITINVPFESRTESTGMSSLKSRPIAEEYTTQLARLKKNLKK
jgi:hypothetical protein